MLLELADIIGSNEIGERSADKLMGIVAQQLSARDVDFFNHTVFVEAGITDRRKVVKIRVTHAGMCKLMLCGPQFLVLELQFKLMNLQFFDEISSLTILEALQDGEKFIGCHSLLKHNG